MSHVLWSKEWQLCVRRTCALLTTALLALLLTAGMAALAYRHTGGAAGLWRLARVTPTRWSPAAWR